MNYKNTYFELCESRQFTNKKNDPRLKAHYIQPLTLGGCISAENTVYLTSRELFLAQWLLCKFTQGEKKHKMQVALFQLSKKYRRFYQKIGDRHFAQASKGYIRGRKYGPQSQAWINKRVSKILGQKRPGTGRKNQWGADNCNFGKYGPAHHTYGKRWKVKDTSKYKARWARVKAEKENGTNK